ncbi:MAG: UbiA family prenyltransferase [Verrucomicrobia bacterium]|nr:UbiA family prenyltransferase [Verrucomicrobiota bacterium]
MFRKIKALLDLGRVSNLPTVWSNCLAAWVLAGAGFSNSESMRFNELEGILGKLAHLFTLPLLCIPAAAASLLYFGGTALNDAFDAKYDREHRPERPIPAGVLSLRIAWIWGLGALLVGAGIFLYMGVTTGDVILSALAIGLVALILIYDWMHKKSVWAALPMGGCRLLLYLLVAFAAMQVTYIFTLSGPQSFEEMKIHGLKPAALTAQQLSSVIAVGASLFVYIVVLTLSARAESGTESLKVSGKMTLLLYLPAIVCAALAILSGATAPQILATLVAATIFVVWTKSAITVLHNQKRDRSRIGIAVGRLLAGICLIDAMAAAAASTSLVPMLVCLGLFVFALFLQRSVSST